MKRATITLGIALVAAAFGTQQAISLQHAYKEGDKDTYVFNITATTQMGAADVNMTMNQLVKKVYENGDADIESTYTEFKILFNGNEIPVPTPPTATSRFSKSGLPISTSQKGGMMGGMSFMKYSTMMFDKPMTVGQVIPIDEKDPKDGTTVKGTVKVDSVADGVAKLISHMEITPAKAEKPMKLDVTTYLDVATAKPNRLEGTATDLPADVAGSGGPPVESVKFVMERKK